MYHGQQGRGKLYTLSEQQMDGTIIDKWGDSSMVTLSFAPCFPVQKLGGGIIT